MKTLVGIDDIASYVPKLYLEAEELAKARGIDPNKIVKGIGIEQLSIPDVYEDAATMAAMATLRLMEKNDLQPKDIDFIHVATESSPDAAKPISCYVLGMLEQRYGGGSFAHIGAPETKFACVGATYAMIDRLAYLASGWNQRKYAIVVGTDIAKYDINSSGEPTQGAAAVALLLGKDPRLMAYEPAFTSFGTVDDRDFFRPIEHTTAVYDGHYSIGCYLRNMRIAADAYKKKMFNSQGLKTLQSCLNDQIDLISFHCPFPKMVEYAFASFLIHDWRGLPKWNKLLDSTGPEPDRAGMSDIEFYISKKYSAFRKNFTKTKEFLHEYEEKVVNSLSALKLIGNSYTASVWLGVINQFEKQRDDLDGKRFGIGSYGSGSSAIICSFIVQPGYKEVVKNLNLMGALSQRHRISIKHYERLHNRQLELHESILPPKSEFTLDHIGKERNNIGYRYYKFIE